VLRRLLAWLGLWRESPALPAPLAPPNEQAQARDGAEARFRACLAVVLKHEGGWVMHPADPGGMTMLGITQRTLSEWLGRPATEKEIRALTPEAVAPIYRKRYWQAIRGDDLPPGLDLAVFDLAVNSGPGRAAKMLQAVLGVDPDGVIGPKTLRRLDDMRHLGGALAETLCDERMAFLRSLEHWPVFGAGWSARVAAVRTKARAMAAVA
jgi:lysozyme family protein